MSISNHQIDELESLLIQSMNGHHLLFDNSKLAGILSIPTEELDLFRDENLNRIQDLITELIQKESMSAKQCFLESLDSESYEMVVRTYFKIVDNSLFTANPLRH